MSNTCNDSFLSLLEPPVGVEAQDANLIGHLALITHETAALGALIALPRSDASRADGALTPVPRWRAVHDGRATSRDDLLSEH